MKEDSIHSIAGDCGWAECDLCNTECFGTEECNKKMVLICVKCLEKKIKDAFDNGYDEGCKRTLEAEAGDE